MAARARARKGLSPLVATVVLISATILGGMLIYNYFQESVDKMQGLSEGLIIDVSQARLSQTTRLVHLEVLNNHDVQVEVTAVNGIYPNGTTIQLQTQETLPLQVAPGGKASINAVVTDPSIVAVSISYQTIDGRSLTTEPQQLK